jgi:hypothetical protein
MLEIRGMMFTYWFVLFTSSCWANLVGLNISSGFNSVVTIYILVPLILVPQLLFSGVVVDFNKMHNRISNDKTVPLIGDMMTSRWAYEALAVMQFKSNDYERNIFTDERQAREANYFRSYAIPGIESILSETKKLYENLSDTVRYEHNLEVIKSEVSRFSSQTGISPGNFLDSLQPDLYSPEINRSISHFLKHAQGIYRNRYLLAVERRDAKFRDMIKLMGEERFLSFRQSYYNKQLAAVVTNEKEIYNYTIHNGEMIPVKDAIFRLPDRNSWRAHFYAPYKSFLYRYIDTFWFNLAVIWFFTWLLLILLYYDVIRKTLNYLETLRINRLNKIKLKRLIKIAEQSMNIRQKYRI